LLKKKLNFGVSLKKEVFSKICRKEIFRFHLKEFFGVC
jgi:hypothetical protein